MHVMKVSMVIPIPMPNDNPLAEALGISSGSSMGSMELGTEFMIETVDEAEDRGYEFSRMMDAFLDGWKRKLHESD